MLASISPFGERARASRWWLTTTAYVVSSAAGGTLLGALGAGVGALVPEGVRWSPVALLVVAVLLLAGLGLDTVDGGARIPSWRRQVDEAWVGRYRGWVVGVGFGAQLGLGVVTIVTSTTTYAVVLLAALAGDLRVGLLLGLAFGLVRAFPLVMTARVHSREQLWRVMRSVESNARNADLLARLSLAGGSLALVVVSLTGG